MSQPLPLVRVESEKPNIFARFGIQNTSKNYVFDDRRIFFRIYSKCINTPGLAQKGEEFKNHRNTNPVIDK